ncbi:MAG TPA: GNAT family N-acetyltransferase [Acidimicrobiia bacterium]|nr:GNAT family N-acetyltransferase [Acidimicrobiia bacterium]HTC80884.1 GNAT family N-acetyltransferase [Acidimicrobiia bacterium]
MTGTLELQIRPVDATDAGRLVGLHARCSDKARYFRFHAAKPRLRAAEADYLAGVDGETRVALAATVVEDGEERIVADARFDVVGDGDAEAALLIRDDMTGRGLGRLLLGRLLELAAGLGVRRILLDILPENKAMLALARRVGAGPVGFDGQSVLYAVGVPA